MRKENDIRVYKNVATFKRKNKKVQLFVLENGDFHAEIIGVYPEKKVRCVRHKKIVKAGVHANVNAIDLSRESMFMLIECISHIMLKEFPGGTMSFKQLINKKSS